MTTAMKSNNQAERPDDSRDQQTSSPGLLTVRQVSEMLQIHVRTVWRMAAAGEIPKPIRIGKKSIRWRVWDIQRFLESR